MKLVLVAAAAFACLAPGAAFAQTSPAPAVVPAPVPAAKFNLDTPLEVLVADEKAHAVLTAGLGIDIATYPGFDGFKAFSLRQIQPGSNGQVTDAMLATIEKGLAEIK